MQELTGAGWAFYKCVTNTLSNAKDTFFIGKEENGTITETMSPSLVYVDDDVLNMYSSSLDNSIEDDVLYNFSVANHFLYGNNFHFINGSKNWTINLSQTKCIATAGSISSDLWCVSKDLTFEGSGVYVQSGRSYEITGFKIDGNNSFVIDGQTYYYGQLYGHVSYGWTNLQSSTNYGAIDNVVGGMTSQQSATVSGVYSLSPDIDSLLKEIVGELKGHYVSTDDLDAIMDSLQNNGVINNQNLVVDGQTEYVPVFDLDSEYLTTLQELVDSILEKSSIYDEVIDDSNAVTPDPGPNYNNQGIAIPPNFNNNIITNVSNIIGLPLQFVSMFSPIFKIFGANVPLFGLWLFFPIVLIIGVVIWVLK